jgi:hypothetical protein
MRIKQLLLMMAVAISGWAQQAATPEPPKPVQKLIELKYANPEYIARLLNGPGVNVNYSASMHAVLVRGNPDAVASLEEMIRKLDVAPPNVELTVYLVSGTAQATQDELPKDLTPVAKQLHGVFAYKSYRLVESFILRSRALNDGANNASLSTNGTLPGTRALYDFRVRAASVTGGTPRAVRLEGMSLTMRTPTSNVDKDGRPVYNTTAINTDLDIGDGQKVVVGKSNLFGTDDALVLVVTAKIVE